jgi:hypothetical protein
MHPVINISVLRPYLSSGAYQPPLLPESIEGEFAGCNALCIGLVVQTGTLPGSPLQISKMPLIKFGNFGTFTASLALMLLTKNQAHSPSLYSRKEEYASYLGTSLSVEVNTL